MIRFIVTSPFYKRALTLIESLMVIAIIGILIAISIPRFSVFNDIKINGAAKKLSADIRYIQAVAMSRHVNTAIRFNKTTEVYRAYYCESNCNLLSNWFLLKDPFTREDLEMYFESDSHFAGIDISDIDFGGTDVLRFDWQGIPADRNGNILTNPGYVTLDFRGLSKSIFVTPQTGRVFVQ